MSNIRKEIYKWAEILNIEVKEVSANKGIKIHEIDGREYKINLPITFTPYASSRPCSANCLFCSEKLVRKNSLTLSNKVKLENNYFEKLNNSLEELKELEFGFSFSGLEYSEDIEWMKKVFLLVKEKQNKGFKIQQKVLYTNGSGFYEMNDETLKKIMSINLSRIEISRHHYDEDICDNIMNFFNKTRIKKNINFLNTIKKLEKYSNIRLVCVLQKNGIDSYEEVNEYIEFAIKLGIKNIVFREMCIPDDDFEKTSTFNYINKERVEIKNIVDNIINDKNYKIKEMINGYYYQTIKFIFKDKIDIAFEKSDYHEMKEKHLSDTIYKFIFWGNGNLTGDWNPESKIIKKY